MAPDEDRSPIYTIGYGNRTPDELLALLRRHEVEYLGDVRWRPASAYHPEYSRPALEPFINGNGLTYVFLGDTLGGGPMSDAVTTDSRSKKDGAVLVDYVAMRNEPPFRQGMERLRTAHAGGHRLVLMCAELRPEQCHRSRLIGQALEDEGIPVLHIDETGDLVSQQEVLLRIDNGQATLPGFGPSRRASVSSHPWIVESRQADDLSDDVDEEP